ncbi:MAG: hypothetical protein AAF317_11385 [Pseudomonadota bacterium]
MYPSELSESERYVAFLIQALDRLRSEPSEADDRLAAHSTIARSAVSQISSNSGIALAFGVDRGQSLRHTAARRTDISWYGFDSFSGYPADGRVDWQREGAHATPQNLPDNVTLIAGFFAETLPEFLIETDASVAFVDICCDLYSSTADVFGALEAHSQLQPGLPILFNQIVNCPDAIWNEMRALYEMLERTGLGFDWQGRRPQIWLAEETLDLVELGCFPDMKELRDENYHQRASLILTGDGLDYGPLDDPIYVERVVAAAQLYDRVSKLRIDRYQRAQKPHSRSVAKTSLLRQIDKAEGRDAVQVQRRGRNSEAIIHSNTAGAHGPWLHVDT